MACNYYQIAFRSEMVSTLSKPWFLRAELPMSSDLSLHRSIPHGGSSSSSPSRRDLVFIVNPRGLLFLYFKLSTAFAVRF